MMIGIDLGNATIKTHTKFNIPNLLTQKNNLLTYEEEDVITIDNESYVIGRGNYETEFNKLEKERNLILIYYILAKLSKDMGNIICLGLPLTQYKSSKDQLKNYILSNRIQNIELNNQSKKIIIEDVYVFSEGLAFYYSLSNDIKNTIGNKDITIIDIGGRTTDICSLSFVNGKRRVEKYTTISIGVLNIYNDIVRAINELYGTDLKLEQGYNIFHEGFYYKGIKQDLTFIKPILKNTIDELFKEINMNFNLKVSIPLLAGGGGIMLEPYFKKRCPHAILVNEPIYGNAIGFYKAGEILWAKN